MPKLLFARPPLDPKEEYQIRKLAGSHHAPADWITRAKMIVGSWEQKRTTTIAEELGCHPQTVRERLVRFNAEGLDGLGDRPGAGRKPRLTEQERGSIIALACSVPPGKLVQMGDELRPSDPEQESHWSLDALTRAAHDKGIQVERSQIRRILRKEGVRWRPTRSWADSTDPDFVPKEPRSSRSTSAHPRARRPSAWTSSAR